MLRSIQRKKGRRRCHIPLLGVGGLSSAKRLLTNLALYTQEQTLSNQESKQTSSSDDSLASDWQKADDKTDNSKPDKRRITLVRGDLKQIKSKLVACSMPET
jgi:hypothetical protein